MLAPPFFLAEQCWVCKIIVVMVECVHWHLATAEYSHWLFCPPGGAIVDVMSVREQQLTSLLKEPRNFGKQPKPLVHERGGSEVAEKTGHFRPLSMEARPCVHVSPIKSGGYP